MAGSRGLGCRSGSAPSARGRNLRPPKKEAHLNPSHSLSTNLPTTLTSLPTPPLSSSIIMQVVAGLKSFGNVCPFLRSSSLSSLASLSRQQVGGLNGLHAAAASGCPLMAAQLRSKGFATSALQQTASTAPAAAPAASAPASAASAPAGIDSARGYATISELTNEQVQGATKATKLDAELASAAGAAAAESGSERSFAAGRPTAALGFAKHNITSARPGFNYEEFYNEQLAKKHSDKSYRVSSPLLRRLVDSDKFPGQPAESAAPQFVANPFRVFDLCSTSTTSTASLSASRSPTPPAPMRRSTFGAQTITSGWDAPPW